MRTFIGASKSFPVHPVRSSMKNGIILFLIRPFDATGDTGAGATLEAFQHRLAMCQCLGVVIARERASLERAHAVDHYGKECLLRDAVDAKFLDGTVLENDPSRILWSVVVAWLIARAVDIRGIRADIHTYDSVKMASTSLPRSIKHFNGQLVIG
jgi:hypothetical protein